MTWAEFKELVKEFLPLEKERGGAEQLLENMIISAVVDIQSYIYLYRKGHSEIMTYGDFAIDGDASVGQMPTDALVTEVYQFYDLTASGVDSSDIDTMEDECKKIKLRPYPWSDRFDLVCGCVPEGYIAIDDQGKDFYVYPKLEADDALLIYYDKNKDSFLDTDTVPFDHACAEAAAYYVASRVEAIANKDLALSQSNQQQYLIMRRRLFIDAKEKRSIRNV